ncbi:hypothetical protein [Nonomuraea maritima]|uniref:hypothetical protein n=1 Tax=Nonomuraea maritima TaxID=683260 RepID=UPI0037100E8D
MWEMMSGYWPNAESISDDPHDLKFAPIWRRTPKVVFSTTLREAGSFPPQERMALRLVDSRVCDGRTAVLRYERG